MSDLSDLTGRTALVTGGGTGIGAAITEVLAEHGADVVIASRKLDNLEAVAGAVAGRTGRRIVPSRADVREEDAVAALVQRVIDEFGRIDILVNNAGGAYMFPLLGTTPDRWDNSIGLNLRAPYLTTLHALPHMVKARQGAIVNISSVAAINGVRGGAAYAAGKAGLQAFTRVVAGEHGPHGIRANAIAVGTVASEGALRSWDRFGMQVADLEREIPLRRVGQPADIAWGVLYLASDMSSWMTGQTLVIDGGPTMPGIDIEV
ncbi:MAG TPA: SDR family oxidoreductase [Streptosporangiaceae bacterium]|jgi:citronellol/citronellal dehydrogenase|nr:SDR family oxidoreductase [Streptosporangiaceae bacterium]